VSNVRQILLLPSPEHVSFASQIFTAADCVYANGSLPPEAKNRKDTIICGPEAWVDALLPQSMISGCARVRWAYGDITQLGAEPLKGLRDLIGTNEYTSPEHKSSAPEAATAAGSPPIPAEAPPEAEHWYEVDEEGAAEAAMRSVRQASALKTAAHKEAQTPADWPDPVNFWTTSKLPAFDERWIIPTMRPFVLNQAAMVGCDPGIPWLQTIAFAAGCLSDDIRVRVRPLQDWAESARIWACVVGDSGDGKSPSMRGIMSQSKELNIEIAERSKHRQAAYKDELDLYELERKAWLAKRQKGEPAGPRPLAPPKPVNEMLYFNDTTSEGLNDQQEATTRGAMCYADEFLGWLLGMDQYKAGGKGSDRQFWLSSWDGAEYVGIRAGKLRTIPNTGVTIVGGSQPGAIRMAASKLNLDSDGLLQRVLVYNSPGEASEGAEQPADRDALNRWRSTLHRLYNMKTHLDHCVFSDHAHEVRKQSNAWIAEMRSITAFPMAARQALSKWRAYLPRIALTLHAIDAADKGLEAIPAVIEEHTIVTAWDYMRECLWPHLLHFYNVLSENTDDRAGLVAFANFVMGRDIREVRPGYLSEKWTFYQRKVKTIQQRREFWESLAHCGWVRAKGDLDRNSHLAPVYEVNPAVFDGRFDEQIAAAMASVERYRLAMHPALLKGRQPGED
jgi:hypothetical protein